MGPDRWIGPFRRRVGTAHRSESLSSQGFGGGRCHPTWSAPPSHRSRRMSHLVSEQKRGHPTFTDIIRQDGWPTMRRQGKCWMSPFLVFLRPFLGLRHFHCWFSNVLIYICDSFDIILSN